MALVSKGRSTLNPDAPLFVPAVFQQVEDFSPEWWELVKTSSWFRDYWMNQHQEEGTFDGYFEDGPGDVVDFLPESIDLDEDFPGLEAQLEDLVQYSDAEFQEMKAHKDMGLDMETMLLNLSKSGKERGPKSPMMSPRYLEKPVKSLSPKCSPRRIHQPR